MIDQDVQRLLDIGEIKKLKARYFRLMDTRQWEAWGGVFTDDCVMEVPEADMVCHGRAEIVRSVSGALVDGRTVHQGHMPEIEVTGPATATGIWVLFDYVEWGDGSGASRVGMQGYGHYHEEYRKEADGAWRISRLRLERLRVDPL